MKVKTAAVITTKKEYAMTRDELRRAITDAVFVLTGDVVSAPHIDILPVYGGFDSETIDLGDISSVVITTTIETKDYTG